MNAQRSGREVTRAVFSLSWMVVLPAAWGQGIDGKAAPVKPSLETGLAIDLTEFTANPNADQAHANNEVVYGDWEGPALVNDIPPGFKVIDGDIVVPGDFDGQTAATFNANLWPGGIIPYEFDANVTPANAAAMLVAMSWWESVAAVDFVPRTLDVGLFAYVHIQNSTGNNSAVGSSGGFQVINIFNWDTTAIMAHELGHALGYWHEQSRSDRNTYVTINTANVCQNCCPLSNGTMGSCNSQFQQEATSDNYGPYDFDSVMHYGRCFFSTNSMTCNATCPTVFGTGVGETLSVNQPFFSQWHCVVGQRTHLSYWDTLVMSFLYARDNWRFQSTVGGSDLFFSGSFSFPYATFSKGYTDTPLGGTLWILQPATFSVGPVLNKRMTIGAPLGGVTLAR